MRRGLICPCGSETSLALLILAGLPAAAQVTITNSSPAPLRVAQLQLFRPIEQHGRAGGRTYIRWGQASCLPRWAFRKAASSRGPSPMRAPIISRLTCPPMAGGVTSTGSKFFSIGVPQITTSSPSSSRGPQHLLLESVPILRWAQFALLGNFCRATRLVHQCLHGRPLRHTNRNRHLHLFCSRGPEFRLD